MTRATADYGHQQRRLLWSRRIAILWWLLVPVLLFGTGLMDAGPRVFGPVPLGPVIWGMGCVVLFGIAFAVYGVCPRCGASFYRRGAFSNPYALRCVNCREHP